MSLLFVCAVRDRAVDSYGSPVFVVATGQAIRSFSDEINNAESAFAKHPEDYDLYQLGQYSQDEGTLIPIGTPKLLVVGKDCVRKD